MANTLVAPVDLSDFPGAPFPQSIVDAAAGRLRAELGWHIAPVATETLTLGFGGGGKSLVLPSRQVTEVTEVRDVSGDTPVVLDGWRPAGPGAATLHRPAGWPVGFSVIEVDLIHGYDECPPELLPALAARAREERSSSVRLGSLSIGAGSSSADGVRTADVVLSKFSASVGF